jgi:hypothetical protein
LCRRSSNSLLNQHPQNSISQSSMAQHSYNYPISPHFGSTDYGQTFNGGPSDLINSSYHNLGDLNPAPRYAHPHAESPIYHQSPFVTHIPPQYPSSNPSYNHDVWHFLPSVPSTSSTNSHDLVYSASFTAQDSSANSIVDNRQTATTFIDQHPHQRRRNSSTPTNLDPHAPVHYPSSTSNSPAVPSTVNSSYMSGTFDISTGFFSKSSEHPRLRTAQACEKCRSRKAKVCVSVFLLV